MGCTCRSGGISGLQTRKSGVIPEVRSTSSYFCFRYRLNFPRYPGTFRSPGLSGTASTRLLPMYIISFMVADYWLLQKKQISAYSAIQVIRHFTTLYFYGTNRVFPFRTSVMKRNCTKEVQDLICRYGMQPHPEGGWFVQTWHHQHSLSFAGPDSTVHSRPLATHIYYLLETGDFSAFHRLDADECWHFYGGGPLHLSLLETGGTVEKIILGPGHTEAQHFHWVVPAGCWMAAKPAPGSAFSLMGCSMIPGFHDPGFELGSASTLIRLFPQHHSLIQSFCRQP